MVLAERVWTLGTQSWCVLGRTLQRPPGIRQRGSRGLVQTMVKWPECGSGGERPRTNSVHAGSPAGARQTESETGQAYFFWGFFLLLFSFATVTTLGDQ